MKLVIDRNPLLLAVQSVIGALPSGNKNLPVLTMIHVQGDGSTIRLTATDLQTRLSATVKDAPPHEPFTVLLPGRRLYELLKAFPEAGIVGIQCEAEKATIKCNKSRFTVSTLPHEEYPLNPDFELQQSFTLAQGTLHSLISYVDHAMAKQDVRYYLNALLFDLNTKTGLNLVGTDGHRMAKIHQAIECESDQQLLMPRESVLELKKLLKDEGTCMVQVGSRQIQVTMVNGLSFSTTLIDGRFPDYERVIPKNLTHSVRLDRVLLAEAVNRVGLVLDKAQQGLALEFGENTLTLQAKARDEDAEEVLEIEYSDTSLIIGINQTYLLEVLKTLTSETVHLQFSGADHPLKIESVENDEGVYVIMPMRL